MALITKVPLPNGKPPRCWKSLEDVDNKIEDFWLFTAEKRQVATISMLAFYLDIDRKTLLEFLQGDMCFPEANLTNDEQKELMHIAATIKTAVRRIEAEYEQTLFTKNNVAGPIFSLKNNYGWEDKHVVDQNMQGGVVVKWLDDPIDVPLQVVDSTSDASQSSPIDIHSNDVYESSNTDELDKLLK